MGFDNSCILFLYSIAAEYFCALCRTLVYPQEALQTPCTHLYCKHCLVRIASTTRACPFDGHLVTEADSKPLVETDRALFDNIGRVLVRCNFYISGCTWQGPLSECIVHRAQCAFGDFHVLCEICGFQTMHREAEAHAQTCSVNAYLQMLNSQAVESHGQHLLMVHPSSGQIPAQVAQPPFPLRPLEPPQRLPPHFQPGLPVVDVQQPIGQQLPQVSAGYTSGHGHDQGQLHHAGGPPQLMQHPPLGQAQQPQQQHGAALANGMNQSGPLRPPRPYDSSSFTFFPQSHYQLGGSFAPSSPARLARGPTTFDNHGKSFKSQHSGVQGQDNQSHPPLNRPPGFASSSTPVPFHGQVGHLGEGFPHQHHSPGTELTRPRLSEPDFRTSGSDSVENLRKRKTVDIGFCHLCQIDCESLEGLDKHRETHDYELMYKDLANNIRLKVARITETSTAHSGLGETSEPESAGSLGCGSKP